MDKRMWTNVKEKKDANVKITTSKIGTNAKIIEFENWRKVFEGQGERFGSSIEETMSVRHFGKEKEI